MEGQLRIHLPNAEAATIQNWRAAEGGFSTETFLLDLVGIGPEQRKQPLVFRRPPEVPLFPDYDLLRQVRIMKAVRGAGIHAPQPLYLQRADNELGTPFYVMERMESIGTVTDVPNYHQEGLYADSDEAGRRRMWNGLISTMADVHRLDWRRMGLSWMSSSPDHPLDPVVGYIERTLPWAHPEHGPVLEEGVRFLRQEIYAPEHISLCWGDARLSNLLFTEDLEIAAVLDWETAFIGDHEADLAWALFLSWASTTQQGIEPLSGTPSREELTGDYEKATGLTVKNARYNEVLAATFLAIPLLRLAARFGMDDPGLLINFCNQRLEELL